MYSVFSFAIASEFLVRKDKMIEAEVVCTGRCDALLWCSLRFIYFKSLFANVFITPLLLWVLRVMSTIQL